MQLMINRSSNIRKYYKNKLCKNKFWTEFILIPLISFLFIGGIYGKVLFSTICS